MLRPKFVWIKIYVYMVIDMDEKFDNTTLREEITNYLYENAVPTHDTIESMTDDIVNIFAKRLTEFNRRPI